jgi:stage V sporulation protein SpoVS
MATSFLSASSIPMAVMSSMADATGFLRENRNDLVRVIAFASWEVRESDRSIFLSFCEISLAKVWSPDA